MTNDGLTSCNRASRKGCSFVSRAVNKTLLYGKDRPASENPSHLRYKGYELEGEDRLSIVQKIHKRYQGYQGSTLKK